MASFHLNETMRFYPKWFVLTKKKRLLDDLSSDYFSLSSTFCTRKAAWMTSFQEHLGDV